MDFAEHCGVVYSFLASGGTEENESLLVYR
jgi:hypothetical protein